MNANPLSYRTYRLRVSSPLAPLCPPAFPDARPSAESRGAASFAETPQVTIRMGAVPVRLHPCADKGGSWERGDSWEAAPGVCLMRINGVARYLVSGGRDILVEPAPAADEREVSLYLFNRVFASLLQQRGVLTLRASVIETGSGAVMFVGRRGTGKSSLLAALLQRGYVMLADGVAGVTPGPDDRFVVRPSCPDVRLCADTMDEMDWWQRSKGNVRRDRKKHLVRADRFRATPLAVRAVYVLTSHERNAIEIDTIGPADAFRQLCKHTHSKKLLRGLGQRPTRFRILTALVNTVPVARLTRPARSFRLDALVDRVERHLQENGPRRTDRR